MQYVGKRHDFANKDAGYARIAAELSAPLAGQNDFIANAASTFDAADQRGIEQLVTIFLNSSPVP